MPKPSERKDLISEVVDLLAVEILEEDFDEDLGGFSPFNEWEELIPVASSVDALFDMVFHNNSKHLQAPVWLQLAVALDKLGTYGSGSTQGRTKIIWGVGKGTLDLFTARVVIALNDLSDVYVKWPDEETRRNISRRMASEGFPGCVDFIDGTTFPLSQKSSINGECYFDRKHTYSLNAQVVCDDRRRIIAFQCGWPGSCADSTVYSHMAFANDELNKYFFQWTSLGELRLQIKRKEDIERLLRWINACVVLHNILFTLGDGWSEARKVDNHLPADSTAYDDETFPFRRRLKQHAVAIGREPGRILWLRGE
ncbi:hypothetical protein PHMEG_00024936 [Phytophthora megakarya]|uniref:DDE Tnp4 domain-containing protein n=1 Tax=Phytophthora megakarya TaxID=4795 RepID=A0A225VCW1_9STRA|nr:hypothetical protein PHMEG_00024936 [Phytophthora megakarya]